MRREKNGMLWLRIALVAICLAVSACGYQWQGVRPETTRSVLGDGTKTIKMGNIEQVSMFSWMPYFLRSLVRDEVNLRRLAVWVDEGPADYVLSIRMPSFQNRTYVSDDQDVTLLSQSGVQLEMVVRNGVTGSTVWQSGLVSYSERYESMTEQDAIKELVTQAMYRGLDRLQGGF